MLPRAIVAHATCDREEPATTDPSRCPCCAAEDFDRLLYCRACGYDGLHKELHARRELETHDRPLGDEAGNRRVVADSDAGPEPQAVVILWALAVAGLVLAISILSR